MKENNTPLTRRKFLTGCCGVLGATAIGAASVPSISALRQAQDLVFNPTEREVDLTMIEPGRLKVVGMFLKRETLIGTDEQVISVMILRRKRAWIDEINSTNIDLKDPVSADERAIDPEWFVARAFCTHLGCTPSIIDEETSMILVWSLKIVPYSFERSLVISITPMIISPLAPSSFT